MSLQSGPLICLPLLEMHSSLTDIHMSTKTQTRTSKASDKRPSALHFYFFHLLSSLAFNVTVSFLCHLFHVLPMQPLCFSLHHSSAHIFCFWMCCLVLYSPASVILQGVICGMRLVRVPATLHSAKQMKLNGSRRKRGGISLQWPPTVQLLSLVENVIIAHKCQCIKS